MAETLSTAAALKYLKAVKPLDGWSTEHRGKEVRLLRRNVALTDNYFLDLHHDSASGSVVGILTNVKNGVAQAQVLVDARGIPTGRKINLISVSTWPVSSFGTTSSTAAAPRETRRSGYARQTPASSTSGASSSSSTPTLSPEQNKQLLTYGAYIVGGLLIARSLVTAMFGLYILAFPLLFIYLLSSCPKEESFDAKKELKRAMRGYHLPEDHPDKPKGFLSETLARINATLATELATGLGYEVTMVSLAGAALVASVRVPSVKVDYYWVGAAGRWWYVYSVEYDSNKRD